MTIFSSLLAKFTLHKLHKYFPLKTICVTRMILMSYLFYFQIETRKRQIFNVKVDFIQIYQAFNQAK